jgi:GPI-anchor transamidase subunit GAA1
MLVIPFPGLGRNTYIDENALQPSQVRRREPCSVPFNILYLQVKTYWDWGNVHTADLYLAQLEQIRDANFTSKQSEHPIAWSPCFFKIRFLDEPSSLARNSSN